MNKKASFADNLSWNILYIILFLLFFAGLFLYISRQQDNAAYWEDYYAKEIALLIDSGKAGDELFIEITQATKIADRSEIIPEEIFTFNNVDNYVSVHLRSGSATRFYFFNDVIVFDAKPLIISEGIETNRLYFKLK